MKKTSLLISCILVLLLTAACASTETPANFPTGKFIKEGETDYGLLFNADGTFQVFEGEIVFVHGSYKVDGSTFTETSNDGGCETNVGFSYAFDGTHLTFNYVGNPAEDIACSGRHTDFNNVTYVLDQS